jgi:broad specificity phosphatase PhoE
MTRTLELPSDLAATLVLVRHGESVWIAEGRFQGRLDPPLSALGERQAALVAARLAERYAASLPIPDHPPLGIWHSPLGRAADTARAIAHAQPAELPLHPTEELTELAQGEWEGLPHAEVSARWPDELAQWRLTPTTAHAPGGESLLDAAGRVSSALEGIAAALLRAGTPTPDAADTAGDAASLRPSPVTGYPAPASAKASPPQPWAVLVAHDGIFRLILMTLLELPYERFWSFPFHLCGISVISLSEGVAALRCHNVTDHLAPLAAEARAAAEARGDRRGAL